MTYGLQIFNTSGALVLDVDSSTLRISDYISVTIGYGTTTQAVGATVTSSNAVAYIDTGAPCAITATGVVTIYGSAVFAGLANLIVVFI